MGWDGMGWDGMGWDGVEPSQKMRPALVWESRCPGASSGPAVLMPASG